MKINHNQIVFGLFFFNILILISAYYIEYILKVPACSMCIYQRIPYFLSTVIIVVFFFKKKKFKKIKKKIKKTENGTVAVLLNSNVT